MVPMFLWSGFTIRAAPWPGMPFGNALGRFQ